MHYLIYKYIYKTNEKTVCCYIDDEQILKCNYCKKKSQKWTSFYVTGKANVDLIMKYKVMTELKHNGTGRVHWQIRKNKIHGQPLGVGWFN